MITDVQAKTIARLTREAVETYENMVDVWLSEGLTTRYYIARTAYQKDLRDLGEALNRAVGRPRALAMREDIEALKEKEKERNKIHDNHSAGVRSHDPRNLPGLARR